MNKNIADWIMEIVERNVEAHYTQNNRLGIWEEERLNSFSGAEAHISRLIYRRNRKEEVRPLLVNSELYCKNI